MYNERGKNKHREKDSLFNKWCWDNWRATCKRLKLDHFLIPYTKINSRWTKNLNVRPDTIKILEENTGGNFLDIGCSNSFLGMSPEAQEIKTKLNYWHFIKIKSFCTMKINNQQNWKIKETWKATCWMGEDICKWHIC